MTESLVQVVECRITGGDLATGSRAWITPAGLVWKNNICLAWRDVRIISDGERRANAATVGGAVRAVAGIAGWALGLRRNSLHFVIWAQDGRRVELAAPSDAINIARAYRDLALQYDAAENWRAPEPPAPPEPGRWRLQKRD